MEPKSAETEYVVGPVWTTSEARGLAKSQKIEELYRTKTLFSAGTRMALAGRLQRPGKLQRIHFGGWEALGKLRRVSGHYFGQILAVEIIEVFGARFGLQQMRQATKSEPPGLVPERLECVLPLGASVTSHVTPPYKV